MLNILYYLLIYNLFLTFKLLVMPTVYNIQIIEIFQRTEQTFYRRNCELINTFSPLYSYMYFVIML